MARPLNGLIAAAAVLVGAAVTRLPLAVGSALAAGASAFLIAGGANAYNDFVDVEADSVNRPGRPVPSGRLGRRDALSVASVFYASGLVIAAFVGPPALILAGLWVIATLAYSRSWQGIPYVGNLVVAVVAASACIMGGLSQGGISRSLVPFALAFLAHLAREIYKDVEDTEGDVTQGRTTAALRYGSRASLEVARGVVVALMIAAVLPMAAGLYGRWYRVLIIVVEAILVWVVVSSMRGGAEHRAGWFSIALKCAMALGLAAIALGVFLR